MKLIEQYTKQELSELNISDVTQIAMQLFITDAAGVYIPKEWAESYRRGMWHGFNYVKDVKPLLLGPDYEGYWENWDNVLINAYAIDENGDTWSLEQDGDLWLINYEFVNAWEEATDKIF